MGPGIHAFVRSAVVGPLGAFAFLAGPGPAEAAGGCTAVMGQATTTPAQMAGWFATTGRTPKLDVGILDLATMFVEEGAREGVRGDIAFAQSIVETGYFGFSPSVPPDTHNYSGIGATGGGVKGARFPDARTGVRAQVQHLRAYADPSLRSAADLHAPLVDPRFGYLVPNPRTVPCWEQFGNGVWAEDPTGYGAKVLVVSQRVAAFPKPPVPVAAPEPAVADAPPVVEPAAVRPAAETEVALIAPLLAGDQVLELARPAPVAELAVRTARAGRSAGDLAAAAATGFTGLALLSICATLWWHGRRFSRA